MYLLFKKSAPFFVAVLLAFSATAQTSVKPVPHGWHLLDRQKDGFYGISMNKAYELVKGKKSTPVIVAIIDSGIDTTHEDLRPILWTNTREIPGNGIDDDGNGYIDDVHGWNFLGGRDGRNVNDDTEEASRVYHKYKAKFANVKDPSSLSKEDQELYKTWLRASNDLSGDPNELMNYTLIRNAYKAAVPADSLLKVEMNKDVYTGAQLDSFETKTIQGASSKRKLMLLFQGLQLDMQRTNKDVIGEIGDYLNQEKKKIESKDKDKIPQNFRADIVKDNEDDINDRFYGNNDIMAGTSLHGTHVSGIIAAVRNNGIGIDGIADNVKIMMIRAVPDGDEHDKDIALAIRYAVDNGARVVNMSFGKKFSPNKNWVDDAVRYAESKGVLLVHAAGNDGANVDSSYNFPNPVFQNDGKRAMDWITVGASGDPRNGGLAASFSNYGKKEVDVFAPGVNIYSSLNGGNTYGNESGTSMASPVTAGVAAFLMEYYPKLSAPQIKSIIEKSAVKSKMKVTKPGSEEQVDFSDLSKNGGIVNLYEAVKMAESMSSLKAVPASTKTVIKKTKRA